MVSLAVIAALFTPFSATYLWLHVQKALIKKEVKAKLIAGIDKSELARFAFSKTQIETELRWEHSREFEYKGEMYDVVETQIIGDSIRYVCWLDRAETALNRRLQTLIAQATSGSKEHRARETLCYQLLKSLALSVSPQPNFSPEQRERQFVVARVQYDSIKLKNPKKPPRLKSLLPYPTI